MVFTRNNTLALYFSKREARELLLQLRLLYARVPGGRRTKQFVSYPGVVEFGRLLNEETK
jgi:hypothetical protein